MFVCLNIWPDDNSGVTFVFVNETKLPPLSNYFSAKESAFSILVAEGGKCKTVTILNSPWLRQRDIISGVAAAPAFEK